MANTPTFPARPYFDDYDSAKKFLRVLFRPGLAVQTRELNQLQTILQEQIGNFADSFFKSGARVIGGESTIYKELSYVKITGALARSSDADYIDAPIENVGGTLKGKIVTVARSNGVDPDTIYIEYTQSDTTDNVTTSFSGDVVITFTDTSTETVTVSEAGLGCAISINDGIFYVNSQFVRVDKQTLILNKYLPLGEQSFNVGLKLVEEIVTPESDPSLLDNALGSPNETAPGAHRFRVNAILAQDGDISVENFIKVVTINDGEVSTPTRSNDLSVFNDILAKRTFDESGDYIVDDFKLEIREHLDNGTNRGLYNADEGGDINKLGIVLDPGTAYVRGYQIITQVNTYLETPKARTTANKSSLRVSTANVSNFVVRDIVELPILFGKILLKEGLTTIGYAYVKSFSYRELELGVPLYDLSFFKPVITAVGKSLSNVDNISSSASIFTAVVTSLEFTPSTAVSVFDVNYGFISNASNVNFEYFREYTSTVNGTELPIGSAVNDQFSSFVDDYIVTINGVAQRPAGVTLTAGNTQATIDVSNFVTPNGQTARVIAKTSRVGGIPRTKTLVTTTDSLASSAAVTLTKYDVQRVESIKVGTVDYTSWYDVDGGQRDTHYDLGKLTLKAGLSAPVGTLTITYQYFQHGSGDFFVAQSYENVNYEDIPYYTTASGRKIFLGSALDYRPRYSSDDQYDIAGAVAVSPFDEAEVTFAYYLPRIDKIALNKNGDFQVVQGVPELNPSAPADLDDSITLYELFVPAYTFKIKDVTAKAYNYRRYTMKDIARIDRRVEALEYTSALSLLESDANSREFIDKFKSGFVVDNFRTQNVVDYEDVTTQIGFDLVRGELRPMNVAYNVNLELDPAQSSNVVFKNGRAYMPYTEKMQITQPLASRIERLQPFTLFAWKGKGTLTPNQDFWVSTQQLPDFFVSNQTTQLLASTMRTPADSFGSVFSWWWNTFVFQVTDTFVGTNVTFTGIPFIRSRIVKFEATGLKPFTRVYPYFDSVEVSAHCAPDGGAYGDPIVTTGAGYASGTFRIPNTSTLRFRVGTRIFELKDNAVNPQTDSQATYTANGTLQTIQRVIQRNFTFIRRYDPLAQSFSIDLENGSFVTAIDIFFGPDAATNEYDATVEIRGMTNGYPNEDVYGRKTLTAAQIGAGSLNGSVATKFVFDEPVYLESDVEYCFVVSSESETLTIWIAQLGDFDVNGQVIAKQPNIGSMFKSQNNLTWDAAQTQDIKFNLYRASFQTGVLGSFVAENATKADDFGTEAEIYRSTLSFDPFQFTSGSNLVVVRDVNHGFIVGDYARLIGPSTGSLNGIPVTQLYNPAGVLITAVTNDTYTIQVASNATITGANGGDGQEAIRYIKYSTAFLSVSDNVLNGTTVQYGLRGVSRGTGAVDTVYTPILARTNTQLPETKVSKFTGDNSVYIRTQMSTSKENISPVVDIDAMGLVAVANRINNDAESVTSNTGAAARYVSRPVSLINPSNEIVVYVDVHRPLEGAVEIYYKVGQSSPNEQETWLPLPLVTPAVTSDNEDKFFEYKFNVLTGFDFYAAQIKIVLKSTNEAKVPKLKNLRTIYVNG